MARRAEICWHIVTGEYPPQMGGVSDYTRQVARALADVGDIVHVWTPSQVPPVEDKGVVVHRLADRFGPKSLIALSRGIKRSDEASRTFVLLQYVPQAFGLKGMNLPFVAWLVSARRLSRRTTLRLGVMFHEVAYDYAPGQSAAHNALATVNRVMAGALVFGADILFASIPAWEPYLGSFLPGRPRTIWLPIPSTLPTTAPGDERLSGLDFRGGRPTELIGHFGTFGSTYRELLQRTLSTLLRTRPGVHLVLAGNGSARFAEELTSSEPGWNTRISTLDGKPPDVLASAIASCDLVVQPYRDGASARRTSLMAPLALGVPVVTNVGALSESLWAESGAAQLATFDADSFAQGAHALLQDPARRTALGQRGRDFYESTFALERTLPRLREAAKA